VVNSQYNLHLLNPAHLGYFKKVVRFEATTKFEMGFATHIRTMRSESISDRSFGTNINSINLAFPLSKTWGTAIGLSPYSTVDYNIDESEVLSGSTITTRREGRGGIYKLYWSNGWGITRWATVGLESSILYGNINDVVLTNISDLNTLNSGFKIRSQYQGIQLKPGLSAHKELFKKQHDSVWVQTPYGAQKRDTVLKVSTGYVLNVGITYDYAGTMNLNRELNLYSLTSANSIQDDSTISETSYKLSMPGSWRAGISVERKVTPKTNYSWMINTDLSLTNWSVMKPSDLIGTALEGDTLANTWGLHIGGEFTPGIKRRSKTFRIGYTMTQLPVQLQGQRISDRALTLGASIPFGKIRKTEAGTQVLPRINLALVLGSRGNASNGLLKENYVRIHASLLINEIWFHKRRLD
jgi:hypothetical protein